jgi:uncharacterized protein YjbJ (UPF0337 family)
VKSQMLIVPVLAAAVLASGCASWDARRGNDYQCGSASANEDYYGGFAGRQVRSGCGADYAGVDSGREIINEGNAMNWDMIEGNWKQFQGHVKEKWGRLTDDHLDTIAGKRDQLAGRIQEAYGITVDQAERQVRAFEEIHRDFQPKSQA